MFKFYSFIFLSLLFLRILTGCISESDKTIVYLVRHAEKNLTDTTDNPPLTTDGEKRAQQLVEEMKGIELAAIFSTEYDRNLNTVKPLAISRNIEIRTYSWHDWQPILDEIKKKSGENFLICGHGDNLLPMIEYLGGEKPLASLGKHEYDNIFKITLSDKKTEVEVIKYSLKEN